MGSCDEAIHKVLSCVEGDPQLQHHRNAIPEYAPIQPSHHACPFTSVPPRPRQCDDGAVALQDASALISPVTSYPPRPRMCRGVTRHLIQTLNLSPVHTVIYACGTRTNHHQEPNVWVARVTLSRPITLGNPKGQFMQGIQEVSLPVRFHRTVERWGGVYWFVGSSSVIS